ncbi:MAG: glycerophosphodiester phosphodiesterase [Armatimonadota bacterium]
MPTFACAHRGDNHCAPENTLPAFELAIAKGAHQIEFDLRVTRDEQLIVLHDEKVDRTTNGTGKTTDLLFDEVRALDAGSWKAAEFTGTRIPTFREVLALVPAGLEVNCQTYLDPRYVPLVIEQIKEFGLLEQCFLASDAAQIAVARQVEPKIRICSLDGQRGPDSDYPDRTIALKAQYIQLWGWADCMPEVCERLHQHDIRVNYFGTEDPAMMRQLTETGVDYVLTDHLDVMHEVMAEYGVSPRR